VFKETRKKRLFFFLLLWALASPAPKKTKNESSLEAAATAISHARRTVESQKRIAVGIGAISASLRGGCFNEVPKILGVNFHRKHWKRQMRQSWPSSSIDP
jgi:hypothetical protein